MGLHSQATVLVVALIVPTIMRAFVGSEFPIVFDAVLNSGMAQRSLRVIFSLPASVFSASYLFPFWTSTLFCIGLVEVEV